MVTCRICKQDVSRRSTLDLAALGAGEGRGCRTHEMVAQLVDACAAAAQEQRAIQTIKLAIDVMVMAAGIRVMATVSGVPAEVFYSRIAAAGHTRAVVDEVRAEVERLGGPIMTPEELGEALLTAMML